MKLPPPQLLAQALEALVREVGEWEGRDRTGRQGWEEDRAEPRAVLASPCLEPPLTLGLVVQEPMPTTNTVKSCPVLAAFPTWAYIVFLTALVGM